MEADAPSGWAGFPPGRVLIMGVLNITPDSFSDGGDHADPEHAVAAGLAMIEAGADILDIGGESTRPGSRPVTPEIEQARILPVISGLAGRAVVSVDTRNAATMSAALAAGARIVNDVSALTHDPDAAGVVARAGCPVVLMHMRGTPETMTGLTDYGDVVQDVIGELARRIAAAEAAGVRPDAIAIDPGIGFAKTPAQSLALLARLDALARLGRPILIGVSRKSFIGRIAGVANPRARLPGSIAAHLWAASHGASILRTHDVAETVQALTIWRAFADSRFVSVRSAV